MKPQLSIEQFNYHLEDKRIAKYPLENRDMSKLLVFRDGTISDCSFQELTSQLPENSLLVFNNTKVIRARLEFQKSTGARIEIFCLEPAYRQDVQQAFSSMQESTWCCIVGNAKKWKEGTLQKEISVMGINITVKAEKVGIDDDSFIIRFTWENSEVTFSDIIDALGQMPIPPYLNRESEDIDEERYQTVYSKHKGSVAAPTAGLHFTDGVLSQLSEKGIKMEHITLHVGAGTFKPVKSATIDKHDMHVESFSITKASLEALINHTGPIVAVGTTTVRTLESLYWLSVKLQATGHLLPINQWDAYELTSSQTYGDALSHLLLHMEKESLNHINAHTAIMIAPSYRFRAIDALITNFHQPQSTLLLLIGALIGDNWKKVYDYALTNNYRFLSYGDSSLLFNISRQK
jgi:S-adenosylmethionine:tRNA ribosyltransferase-isomerase